MIYLIFYFFAIQFFNKLALFYLRDLNELLSLTIYRKKRFSAIIIVDMQFLQRVVTKSESWIQSKSFIEHETVVINEEEK